MVHHWLRVRCVLARICIKLLSMLLMRLILMVSSLMARTFLFLWMRLMMIASHLLLFLLAG